jgi:hypothetical protein
VTFGLAKIRRLIEIHTEIVFPSLQRVERQQQLRSGCLKETYKQKKIKQNWRFLKRVYYHTKMRGFQVRQMSYWQAALADCSPSFYRKVRAQFRLLCH